MVRNLQHIALGVPDLEAGRRFYTAAGLEAAASGNRLVLRCAGRDQDQIVLNEAPRRHTNYISFGTTEEDLATLQSRLRAAGVSQVDPPEADAPPGLWLHDPDGVLVNVQVRGNAPIASPGERMNSPGDYRRLNARGVFTRGDAIRPRRLGHVLLFTPNVGAKVRFYIDLLGMRLSDTVAGGVITFLRCGGASDHHVVALAYSERPGFHHASFEVGSLDEIVLGAQRLADAGFRKGWGTGRHVIGSNFFHYTRDPWNGLLEYFWDIDFVPDGAAWDVRDWRQEDAFYLWASDGPPPKDFVYNYEGE